MPFPVKYKNERDVEIPLLIEFIKAHPDIKRALDVGCARSFYACEVQKLIKCFDCVDFELDTEVFECVDNYFSGDLLEQTLDTYDLVFAISAIEHYGVKVKPVKFPLFSQEKLVKGMARLAKKYLFFTVPYGEPVLVKDNFMNYSRSRLVHLLWCISKFRLEPRFFFNPCPSSGGGWSEFGQSAADTVAYIPERGVNVVCVVEGVRKHV